MTSAGALVAFIVTLLFMFALRPVAAELKLIDIPGGRKRHDAAVPVIGGVCMAIGLTFGAAFVPRSDLWNALLLAVYLLVIVGTIDDRFDIRASIRLVAQTCAALLVAIGGGVVIESLGNPFFFPLPLGSAGTLFTVMFIVTVINAFNFIDGIDGLAGALAGLSLVAFAAIGHGTETFAMAVLLMAVVSAYLLFNFPLGINRHIRTFMGDAGSTVLGLLIACMGINLTQGADAQLAPAVGLWFIAVPVFDLFSSIIRRTLSGRSPFAPDHDHMHHRLIAAGLSRRETLSFMLLFAAACVGCGLLGRAFGLPDGVMCLAWLGGGAVYYQASRRPALAIRIGRAAVARADRSVETVR